MINVVILGYVAFLGLAAVLRWPYRIWLWLLLGTLGAGVFAWQYLKFGRAQFPEYKKEVTEQLRARPWPADPADLARLIASFKAVGDMSDLNTLRRLYQLEVARGLAGEPPEHFGTVAEALAWKPPDTAPRTPTSTALERERAERRALNGMLEVGAPRASGWPAELARAAPLGEGAREVAPGVWIEPKETDSPVGALRFPLRVQNRGKARIADAHLTVVVGDQEPADGEAKPRRFSCHVTLHDVAPGQAQWASCDVTVGMGSERVIHRLLDGIERFRAGELSAQVRAGGELDASVRQVPDAAPLIPEELRRLQQLQEDDKQRLVRRDALVPQLQLALLVGAIFVAGFLIPGFVGRSLSVVGTLAVAAGGGVVAFAAGIVEATRTPGVQGWELIIAVFAAFEYGVTFVGGLLLGDLVYLRQKKS